jgi:indolepyruvate ferredoxin oxidoreductase, alpha subunit
MDKLMLLGDEAIAQAALDSGISGIYGYPGTPSTEIAEYVQSSDTAREKKIHCDWSVNEKTAMEASLGMSYAGKRVMVCMKHVGLNVAADAFINSALTGANGGLVVVVADDPSMHSSQNEQDSRFYGKFALVPVFEPSNQQQAYDMTCEAFIMSEKYKIPVLLRITTRLAHSRSEIVRRNACEQNILSMPDDPKQFILLPALARVRYKHLLDLQENFKKDSEDSEFNLFSNQYPAQRGIITTGIAWNYIRECFEDEQIPYPFLKIGQYPLPVEMVKKLMNCCNEIFVFEEGFPFVEEMIKGITDQTVGIHGRLDGTLPKDGELNPDLVARVLGFKTQNYYNVPDIVQSRPPVLCNGCAHIDLYHALNEAMAAYGKGKVFSDIGCYTLGALPPFEAIFSCVDMGASVTMAKGASDAGLFPSACVIGDSTFTHSGITGLLDAINEKTPITVIISDNSTTGMTGGQKSAATGKIENICHGLGVEPEHLRLMNPLKKYMDENVKMIREEMEYRGVSVIISQRECIQTAARRNRSN